VREEALRAVTGCLAAIGGGVEDLETERPRDRETETETETKTETETVAAVREARRAPRHRAWVVPAVSRPGR